MIKNLRSYNLICLMLGAAIAILISHGFHKGRIREYDLAVKEKLIEKEAVADLIQNKNLIEDTYARVVNQDNIQSADAWIGELTRISGDNAINLDSIIPIDEGGDKGRLMTRILLRFQTDSARLGRMLYQISGDKPLVSIESIALKHIDGSRYDCEIELSRIFIK